MQKTLSATVCLIALSAAPALAQHHGGGGGGFGAAFGGAALGGAVGGALGGLLAQPAPQRPPPVYYAPPPVYYERRVYVAPPPVYVAPVAHIAFHPWAGPGFACYEPEPNAVNRAICSSADLSEASLAEVQAVYAAIQQTPYNASATRAEYAATLQATRSSCAPYAFSQQGECIAGQLAQARHAMLARLSGVYADEANRPIAVHLQVQQQLHAIGLLPGTADGVYGDGTRRAITNWQSGHGHATTGVLSNDEVAMLLPGFAPIPYVPSPVITQPSVAAQTAAPPPGPAAPAAITPPAPTLASAAPATATDPMNGVHENMPYALARPKLFAAGWQTQFFTTAGLSDQDRDPRQWFIDHHITEVQDCSSSGCKMQFHNADGRLLYVYTQTGSHASDAYRGAGPSVIAWCMDADDITCPAPASPTAPVTQQAIK